MIPSPRPSSRDGITKSTKRFSNHRRNHSHFNSSKFDNKHMIDHNQFIDTKSGLCVSPF